MTHTFARSGVTEPHIHTHACMTQSHTYTRMHVGVSNKEGVSYPYYPSSRGGQGEWSAHISGARMFVLFRYVTL